MFQSFFRKKSINRILLDAGIRDEGPQKLNRSLTVFDLTALGIAAVIGAGIFSTIGNAAASGGPAVSLLFLFTALACAFSALCYAQFASVIPISGSAYTYAYASFGELIAWIIGWDLIMEYAIGNVAVAISWSEYFTGLMGGLGLHLPDYLTTDYLSAARGYRQVVKEMLAGIPLATLPDALQESYRAWITAPVMGGVRLIADIPAFAIIVFITGLVYIGIYESKVAGNTMVLIKVGVLLLIIVIGSFYIDTGNWHPFAPHGISGVLKGVSAVFFAYIGFDAISTTAEECRNPRRDLPRAIILALIITTLLYVMISLVLTGMAHYSKLGVGDPLAFVFKTLNLPWLSGIIALTAVVAMASVMLVFQLGQPRIWMSMSRDGLLPPSFSKIHPKYKTPWFSTIVAGILVAIPSLFMNLTEVTDLTSIGTLFAFILVSGGVLVLRKDIGKERDDSRNGKTFHVPYLNSRYYLPVILALVLGLLGYLYKYELGTLLSSGNSPTSLFHLPFEGGDTQGDMDYASALWILLRDHFPVLLFLVFTLVLTVVAILKKLSLIPVLGLLTNFYLMAQLGPTNWFRFLIWLAIGLVIYFLYGRKHSKLLRDGESQKPNNGMKNVNNSDRACTSSE